MVAKRFGAFDLSTGIAVVVMTGVNGTNSTVNVRFCNRNNIDVRVRLAMVNAPANTAISTMGLKDFLEYDTVIMANEVLEDTGLAVPEGYSLVAQTDTSGVTVIAYGYEENKI